MKVLFSADEHLVLRRKGVPKEWEINRFNEYHNKIVKLIEEHNIDVLIHGGDFFDRDPNWEEVVLAFHGHFNKLTIPTYIIDGNHEAKRKGTTFLTDLKKLCHNPLVTFVDHYVTHKGIDFLPYCKLKEYAANPLDNTSNILVTHVRGAIEPHVHPEVDLDIFSKWELVLAGDLHDRSNSQKNIMYPGSPMTTHAYRDASIKKGVLIVDTGTLECKFVDLDLPKLLRKTVTDPSMAIQNGVDHIDYEIVLPAVIESLAIDEAQIPQREAVKRIDALASVLDTNPLKQEVIAYYVDLTANQDK